MGYWRMAFTGHPTSGPQWSAEGCSERLSICSVCRLVRWLGLPARLSIGQPARLPESPPLRLEGERLQPQTMAFHRQHLRELVVEAGIEWAGARHQKDAGAGIVIDLK